MSAKPHNIIPTTYMTEFIISSNIPNRVKLILIPFCKYFPQLNNKHIIYIFIINFSTLIIKQIINIFIYLFNIKFNPQKILINYFKISNNIFNKKYKKNMY